MSNLIIVWIRLAKNFILCTNCCINSIELGIYDIAITFGFLQKTNKFDYVMPIGLPNYNKFIKNYNKFNKQSVDFLPNWGVHFL